ncbi:merozoite surface protein 7 [Plasmodium cynomolgi strain B]|uniref:Merozoite surface protein 7 n=1 Tax=Plasmodium cynomolgi (strain B) TaxID=1120755 RepID=K6VEN0_PLACD|nr:merozoite surface protein 7 [Plasmodium cynomolgi strain B]GAB67717.1 merozoite surface protein 7 [Plasmodium cynomolgi strain B]
MRKKIAFVCSIFALLSCNCVLSEKLGIQKKKKNLEQDAMHILMKKLENLYRLSATDNSEVLNKEIESLKKQIDQLHQHGGVIEGENLGHLLESEAANESTKKTIFGVDEDDLDNYDVDFTGQSKGKIKGQTDPTPVAEPPAHNGAGDQESPAPPAPSVLPGMKVPMQKMRKRQIPCHLIMNPLIQTNKQKRSPLCQERAQRAHKQVLLLIQEVNKQFLFLHQEVNNQAEEAEEQEEPKEPEETNQERSHLQKSNQQYPHLQETIHNRPL